MYKTVQLTKRSIQTDERNKEKEEEKKYVRANRETSSAMRKASPCN